MKWKSLRSQNFIPLITFIVLVFTHHEAGAWFSLNFRKSGRDSMSSGFVKPSVNLQELSLHPFPTIPLPSHLFMATILT